MRRFLKGLSPTTEFVAVVSVAFGYFVLLSLADAVHVRVGAHHSTGSLIALAVYEIALTAILCAFLATRGWTLERIGLNPSLKDTAAGVVLFFVASVVWYGIWAVIAIIAPDIVRGAAATSQTIVSHGLSMTAVGVVSIVNPIFEETFETAYVMTALRGRVSPVACVNVSVAIRLLCHLYQGTLGVIGIIPIGLMAAYWYLKTGRLWPLIVAHALTDFMSLASFR
jgi:uncharacterized protein